MHTYDAGALHAVPAGGISIMPAETRHFAYTKDGAVINDVNAADDPRKPAAN